MKNFGEIIGKYCILDDILWGLLSKIQLQKNCTDRIIEWNDHFNKQILYSFIWYSILLYSISYFFSTFVVFLSNSVIVLNNNNSISMGLLKQDEPFSQDVWCPGKNSLSCPLTSACFPVVDST